MAIVMVVLFFAICILIEKRKLVLDKIAKMWYNIKDKQARTAI